MKTRMVIGCVAALMGAVVMFSGSTSTAQTGGGGFGGRGGGGMAGIASNPLFLLMNEKVREELEVVDEQMDELTKLQDDIRSEMQNMFQGMGNVDPSERQQMMDDLRKDMEDKSKSFQAKVDKILLPHQQTRLKQLVFQSQARGQAGGSLLNSEELKDQLDITPEQEDKMKEAAEKAQEEMRAKVLKLQQEAEAKIIAVLSTEQQQKYKTLVGDPFDFGTQGAFGGQGGRGQGGRGGQGGGRGGQGGGRGGQGGGGQSDF